MRNFYHTCKFSSLTINFLKMSSKRLKRVLKKFLQNVLKTLWRRLGKKFWRCLEEVLKTSWRCMAKKNMLASIKTSWRHTLRIILHIFNQAMKFGQLIEFNMRKIFHEKSYTKCGGDTIPRPFSEKSNLSKSLDQ